MGEHVSTEEEGGVDGSLRSVSLSQKKAPEKRLLLPTMKEKRMLPLRKTTRAEPMQDSATSS